MCRKRVVGQKSNARKSDAGYPFLEECLESYGQIFLGAAIAAGEPTVSLLVIQRGLRSAGATGLPKPANSLNWLGFWEPPKNCYLHEL